MNNKLDKIYEVLDKLNTKDVLIIYLRGVMDLTLEEIGERVMMSHEGVRKRLKKIYKLMGSKYD